MGTPTLVDRLKACVLVQRWQWWQLPLPIRCYVAVPPLAALAVVGFAAAHTDWRMAEVAKFLLLLCCGAVSVASTPRMMYTTGGLTVDFSQIWVLPIAVLLPPVFAALAPIPFMVIMHLVVRRGVIHRMVFTGAAISISYSLVSLLFHHFSPLFSGSVVGSGVHAFVWTLVVAACEVLGGRGHHFMILGAVKLSDPKVRLWKNEFSPESLQAFAAELYLGVLIALIVALSPILVVLALPTVLLVRRFLVHPILVAQSRVDAKTGLLNVSTWEKEAEAELSRAVRTRNPMSVALVDIDHFKAVNDTYGHLVGDRVLKALAEVLTGHMRDYDRAGRFGGEEFVLLLAQAKQDEACRIAERLRRQVGEMTVPVSDAPGAALVRLTVSIGVTAMEAGKTRELTDMLAAADSALYEAKQTGRNRVCVGRNGLDAELERGFASAPQPYGGPVAGDPAGASLGLSALRSAHTAIRGVLQPFALKRTWNPVQDQRATIACSASW